MVGSDMLARVGRLLLRGADVSLVADDPSTVADLAAIAAAAGRVLPVLVDLDVGQGRTGCADPDSAVALAQLLERAEGLAFNGVQAYWGNLQQVTPFDERRARVQTQAERLDVVLAQLRSAGLGPDVVTGGGTGTSYIDPTLNLFTEIQPGSYLFLDSCYGEVRLDGTGGDGGSYTPSLFVSATVVSAARPGRAIVNAGFKALATLRTSGSSPRGAARRNICVHGGRAWRDRLRPPEGKPARLGPVDLLTSHCCSRARRRPRSRLRGRLRVPQPIA
jgi:D-serine deaminase-like pyridoxal phosphate-dependent protein